MTEYNLEDMLGMLELELYDIDEADEAYQALEQYDASTDSLEEVYKVKHSDETNPGVIRHKMIGHYNQRALYRRHYRSPRRHTHWKDRTKTNKPWGNRVDKRRIIWTQ